MHTCSEPSADQRHDPYPHLLPPTMGAKCNQVKNLGITTAGLHLVRNQAASFAMHQPEPTDTRKRVPGGSMPRCVGAAEVGQIFRGCDRNRRLGSLQTMLTEK